ncbi:MAG: hypothetical protein P1P76_01030 [Anaerolineales bacterium]|nr:hypothetical protein [Anaerolineales bacterium]
MYFQFPKNKMSTLMLAAVLSLTGCSADSPPPKPPPTPAQPDPEATAIAAAPETEEPDITPTVSTHEDLDLREANVLDVQYDDLGEGRYRFDVTLLHDDQGEAPSFADSWQVWDLQGNLLGERVLAHSHGTQPFTRSATIEIPEGVSTVLVRGHDMEHGHGGQSMRVDLESGEMEVYEEGR